MHQIIQALSDWYNHALQTGGYPAIVLMMAVEILREEEIAIWAQFHTRGRFR